MEEYTDVNSKTIDKWIEEGWEWGIPVSGEEFARAKNGDWNVLLTPSRYVPREWFPDLKGKKLLGLASGGGQQIPLFTAAGAVCTVMDYSQKQLDSERLVASREGYDVTIVRGDMTKPFPFGDETFDVIFHPVSNCYIEDVAHVWRECFRVLKRGGVLLAGLDNGINFVYNEEETEMENSLPFNPLKDARVYEQCIKQDLGIQFSHTIQEQIGAQIKAGFTLTDVFEDTNGSGVLHEHNVPTFFVTRAVRTGTTEIRTPRLRIFPLDVRLLAVQTESRAALDAVLGLEKSDLLIDSHLEQAYREMYELCASHEDEYLWYTPWQIVVDGENRYIGSLGFKGAPDENGRVEIGYGIEDISHRRKGYCAEAVLAACEWAMKQPGVTTVLAQTEEDNDASRDLLLKCGFVRDGYGDEGPMYALRKS